LQNIRQKNHDFSPLILLKIVFDKIISTEKDNISAIVKDMQTITGAHTNRASMFGTNCLK
jgi:hypothetical protein